MLEGGWKFAGVFSGGVAVLDYAEVALAEADAIATAVNRLVGF